MIHILRMTRFADWLNILGIRLHTRDNLRLVIIRTNEQKRSLFDGLIINEAQSSRNCSIVKYGRRMNSTYKPTTSVYNVLQTRQCRVNFMTTDFLITVLTVKMH